MLFRSHQSAERLFLYLEEIGYRFHLFCPVLPKRRSVEKSSELCLVVMSCATEVFWSVEKSSELCLVVMSCATEVFWSVEKSSEQCRYVVVFMPCHTARGFYSHLFSLYHFTVMSTPRFRSKCG